MTAHDTGMQTVVGGGQTACGDLFLGRDMGIEVGVFVLSGVAVKAGVGVEADVGIGVAVRVGGNVRIVAGCSITPTDEGVIASAVRWAASVATNPASLVLGASTAKNSNTSKTSTIPVNATVKPGIF
jgi:hypothetical protein